MLRIHCSENCSQTRFTSFLSSTHIFSLFFLVVSYNLRRDLTAETSLMNDLDKRLNFESDTSRETPYTPEPVVTHRNVNLLSSDHSSDQSHEEVAAAARLWAVPSTTNDVSNTNSDNSFNSVSGKFCHETFLSRTVLAHLSEMTS